MGIEGIRKLDFTSLETFFRTVGVCRILVAVRSRGPEET